MKILLSGITIRQVNDIQRVNKPLMADENWQINQDEFALQAEGIGNFYASEGKYVEFIPIPGTDPDLINLILNGQVLAALLHQRKIIHFHASSFIYKNLGIMILGETGAGKSSITASFLLEGAEFLSDDITPVIFPEGMPNLWPLNSTLKLRENAVKQLLIKLGKLKKSAAGTGKFSLETMHSKKASFPLNIIFKIEIGDNQDPEFEIPDTSAKFSILRSEICSWEMLKGMALTEKEYFHQLIKIVEKVRLIRIIRPEETRIMFMHELIEDIIEKVWSPT